MWSAQQVVAFWGKATSVKLHLKDYKAVWTCKGERLSREIQAKDAKEHCCKKEKLKEVAFLLGTLAASTG